MSETVKQKNNKEKRKKTEKEHLNMRTVIVHNVLVTLLIMGIFTVMAQAFFITVRTLPVLQLSMCWQSCW